MNHEYYISKGWNRPAQHFMEYHKCKHTKFAFESPFEHIKGTKETKRVYWWRKKERPVTNLLEIDPFSQPPENFDKWTPLLYFRKFWSNDITEQLVDQAFVHRGIKERKYLK